MPKKSQYTSATFLSNFCYQELLKIAQSGHSEWYKKEYQSGVQFLFFFIMLDCCFFSFIKFLKSLFHKTYVSVNKGFIITPNFDRNFLRKWKYSINCSHLALNLEQTVVRKPWSSGYGRRLMFQRS